MPQPLGVRLIDGAVLTLKLVSLRAPILLFALAARLATLIFLFSAGSFSSSATSQKALCASRRKSFNIFSACPSFFAQASSFLVPRSE